LCAGIDDDGYSFNTAAYLFTVNIVLTEAGLSAGPGCGLAPVGLLFNYIKLITTTGRGATPQWRWGGARGKVGWGVGWEVQGGKCGGWGGVGGARGKCGGGGGTRILLANYMT
jgi:hypothetical protein